MVFKMRTFSLPRTKEDLSVTHDSSLKRFSWRELKLATDNFSKVSVVGRGGFGSVYRGQLADGSLVAIKRCTDMSNTAVEPQFQSEVEIGGSQACDHPNILRLVGYCMTRKERILVYPFLVNRSVDSWLHDRLSSDPPLDWSTRKGIALGAAKGLAHLHYGSAFTVIHRDIKPHNILLDDQFEAVLCDFGTVKFIGRNENESNSNWVQRPMEEQYDNEDTYEENEEEDSDHCFTKSCWNFTKTEVTKWSCWLFTKNEVIISESGHTTIGPPLPSYHQSGTLVTTSAVCGTPGYLDPYYYSTGKCSVKTDVYGYGVTLLQLVTGQRANDLARRSSDGNYVSLQDWVEQRVRDNKFDLLVDSELRGDYECIKEEMKQLVRLALLCTKQDPVERPVMPDLINIIENLGKFPLPDQLLGAAVQGFTLPQLKLATHNFSHKNVIGKSGFSNVYRGRLIEDGSLVVVKRMVERSKRTRLQFQAELKLGAIRHPNMLKLRGYCFSRKEMFLVYPFMPNRSLEWQLRPERSLALDWHVRMKIALGAAKGISCLHYDCDSNVRIRCNIKPSNVLLDDDFNSVLCNLRGNEDDGAVYSVDDVHAYGITLFMLITGNCYNDSGLHDRFKKLMRHHQLELLFDPRLNMGGGTNYDTMHVKDEIEQLIQLALLCTQPSPKDRPEMWQVMHMLQGISEGDLKVCFAFDRANFFWFDESLQPQLSNEVELSAVIGPPKLDSEGSLSQEFDQTNEFQPCINPKQESNISSKDKDVASFSVKPTYSFKAQHIKPRSRYEGITFSDNVLEPKKQEKLEIFLSEVVSNALPTKSKLGQSGNIVDLLCPLCNEHEEDSFHLFFNCDFSRQAWLLAMGVRIDMLGFRSAKEAVDVILKPDGAGLNILPPDVEPSRFTHKGVALMHSIWTHRNQVCLDNVCLNVIQMLKDHPDATHLYESPSATTQKEVESESTLDADECLIVVSDLASFVQCGFSHEIELLPEKVLPKVLANCVPCESSQDIQPTQQQSKRVIIPQILANCVQCESSQEIQLAQLQSEQVLILDLAHCKSSKEIEKPRLQTELLFPEVLASYVRCESIEQAHLQAEEVLSLEVLPYCDSRQEIEPGQLQTKGALFPQVHADCVKCESNQEIELIQLQPAEVVVANCVQCKSSQEVEPAQLQPEKVLVPKVLESGMSNNQEHDFQLNITSGGIFLSFKFSKLSVLCVILLASLCMNIVSIWPSAKPRY